MGGLFVLVKEILESLASAGVTELAKCLCLNLADSFTCYAEFTANLFKSVRMSVLKAETKCKHLCLSLGKGLKNFVKLLFKEKH